MPPKMLQIMQRHFCVEHSRLVVLRTQDYEFTLIALQLNYTTQSSMLLCGLLVSVVFFLHFCTVDILTQLLQGL